MSTDWHNAKLDPADYAMMEYAEKLSVLPSAIIEDDIEALRGHGFTDKEVLSVNLAAAYRNYIVRVADGLGVELAKDYAYPVEVLEAFGVNPAELKTTIYGDRQTALKDYKQQSSSSPHESGAQESTSGEICWLGTAPDDSSNIVQAIDEASPIENLAKAIAIRPDALQVTLQYGQLLGMGGSGLGPRLEAIIGLAVAATQWSPYMGVHHAHALLGAGGTPEEVESLVQNPSKGTLGGGELQVARYCEKLTRLPRAMARSDVDELREQGFGDRDILTIALSASFENFLGCVASGLGVKLEDQRFDHAAVLPFKLTSGLQPEVAERA